MQFRPFIIALGSVALLAGCENKNADPTTRQEEPYSPTYTSSDSTVSVPESAYIDRLSPHAQNAVEIPPVGGTYTDSSGSYSSGAPVSGYSDEPLEASGDVGGRTHMVSKGDTLYALARSYYGNQSRWRDIWQANQTRVPDPNRLAVGTRLIIP